LTQVIAVTFIEAAAKRLGWERGRDVTITYAKGIHDRSLPLVGHTSTR
jgi:hypothetical protein